MACEGLLYQTHKELERSKRDHLPNSLAGQHNMAEYVQVQGQNLVEVVEICVCNIYGSRMALISCCVAR